MGALFRLLCHPPYLWGPLLLHRAGTLSRQRLEAFAARIASTYDQTSPGPFCLWLSLPPSSLVASAYLWLPEISKLFLAHRFDWLGLGWQYVGYDSVAPGIAGFCCHPPALTPDREGVWLNNRISSPNFSEALRLWRKLDHDYIPIDWQRDHRSGFRWNMSVQAAKQPLYPQPGVDVKQPWELARLQHLPLLALAHSCAQTGIDGYLSPESYVKEFQNIIYDFLSTNPPRFGVNWMCSMDVAIRLVNLLVATDLFIKGGARFDDEFMTLMTRATAEHARHIKKHLERRPDFRANHYLANLAGLLFAGAYLDPKGMGQAWWRFAVNEICSEVVRQFLPDGANFEASTGYHRLSGEIAVWSLALVCAVEGSNAIDSVLRQRLAGIARFVQDTCRFDGSSTPIGDLDNGRLLKLSSYYKWVPLDASTTFVSKTGMDTKHEGKWQECLECHKHIVEAVDCFFVTDVRMTPETFLLRQCIGSPLPLSNCRIEVPSGDIVSAREILLICGNHPQHRYQWHLPGNDTPCLVAYPDFGLYVVRTQRWLLTLRCGTNGQQGNGGHAHNDQLSLTLEVDGVCLVDDAGMVIYNALPNVRRAYRSVAAHFVPRPVYGEPASLDLDPFRLPRGGEGRCLYFGDFGFIGIHDGYGNRVARSVNWGGGNLCVEDYADGIELVDLMATVPENGVWQQSVPLAPRYGQLSSHDFIMDTISP